MEDCHTHTQKSRFHIWETSIIQHFSKNLNLSSQVGFCSTFLITWPLPHSMTSDRSSLHLSLPHTSSIVLLYQPSSSPTICTFLRPGSKALYQPFAYQVNIPRHFTVPSCKFLHLYFITFLYISYLTVITFTSGSVFGSAATTVIWSSIKQLCFSQKVNKINFFPQAARHEQLFWLYGSVLTRETGICWPAPNSSLKDTQSQKDAHDLSACGKRWGREGCNMNANLFRNPRIYTEMGKKEKEAYKSRNCWKVSDSTYNWLGKRE